MINNDRIVPITRTDYLTFLATICELITAASEIFSDGFSTLPAADVEGNFTISQNGTYILDQPAKNVNVFAGVTAQILFLADYEFEGFQVDGVPVVLIQEVKKDAATLYGASISSGEVSVFPISPDALED